MKEKIIEESLDLVKKESSGVIEKLFPYFGLKKLTLDTYVNEIKESNLSPDTKVRLIMDAKRNIKSIKNQKSIIDIALANIHIKEKNMNVDYVDEDWINKFIDSAAYISSEDLQIVWGKILANELNEPGTTPPTMIRVLSEITPKLAMVFRKLCCMKVWILPLREDNEIDNDFIHESIFVPYSKNDEMFRKLDIYFEEINELDSLGVIKFDSISGYVQKNYPSDKALMFDGKDLILIKGLTEKSFPVGNVMLTSAGVALLKITQTETVEGYSEMLMRYLERSHCSATREHGFNAILNGTTLEVNGHYYENHK